MTLVDVLTALMISESIRFHVDKNYLYGLCCWVHWCGGNVIIAIANTCTWYSPEWDAIN